jgi:hypothetical protein
LLLLRIASAYLEIELSMLTWKIYGSQNENHYFKLRGVLGVALKADIVGP